MGGVSQDDGGFGRIKSNSDAYLMIASLKRLLFVDPDMMTVALHRRQSEGAFALEVFSTLNDTIPLPEMGVELPLADIFEE